jgi:hypothetical protein
VPSTNDVDLDANDFTIVHDAVVAVDIIGNDAIANKVMQLRVSAAIVDDIVDSSNANALWPNHYN